MPTRDTSGMARQIEKLSQNVDKLAREVGRSSKQARRAGGPAGQGVPTARGGRGGLAGKTGFSFGQLARGAAVGTVARIAGQGAESISQGGSFAGGVFGASRSLLAKVPVLGELSGAAVAEEADDFATKQTFGLLNQIARFTGPTPELQQAQEALVPFFQQQGENLANFSRQNRRFVQEQSADRFAESTGDKLFQIFRGVEDLFSGG